uniref:Reverse transcriptase domain-containing protein n=1 Tax=Fagus sylvatica TaxID=28930 RepID=A0A2N9G208_FAGSY
MEGAPNDGTSADPTMTPIERQMQVIATSIQDLARETSRQNQELWQAIRKGPPTPHDNNQPPPRGGNRSNDQEADSHQVTRRRGDEAERTPPRSRHRAESAGSSAPPSQHKTAKTTRSSKQPERPDRSSKQPEREDRQGKLLQTTRSSRSDPQEIRMTKRHRNFDGTKDPFDYLEAFKTIMQLQAVPEEVMCRAFPLGLRGSARVWFNKLESESIGSFVQLSRAFIDHFIGSQRRGRPPTHLAQRQANGRRITEDICTPLQRRSDEDRSSEKKMSQFHRDHGHLTEECVALKEQVETLIRQGKLQKYVNRPTNTRPAKPPVHREQAEPNRPGPVGEIRTIVGGPASGGTSRASRKAYARQVHNIMVVQRPPKNIRLDDQIISFSEEDARGTHQPHDDALVITINIAGFTTRRVMVDNGSSADILYLPAYQQMQLDKDKLRPMDAPLVGFTGDKICPVGIVTLPIMVGTHPKTVSKTVDFLVVNCPSAYNAIIGRPTLNRLRAVTSTYHLLLKFPTEHGIGEVRGDQVAARECYLASLGSGGQNQTMSIEEQKVLVKPSGELATIELEEGRPERTTKIGADLPPKIRESLVQFLKENKDVFAWSHEDMPGINPSVISHKLNVDPSLRPIKQKRRVFAPERNNAIMEEVDKLLAANFIREVFYPDWLANVVMVKKNTGKWRMCVDFTDLNKACPKDSFPLPRIDQLVDSTAGHKLLTFMDAFSGYNQIVMDEGDQEKTSFITSRGLFCYKVMPFGLKNAGATYQRLMNRMFHDQIGRNVEVYVDDMLVKSKEEDGHLDDLRETFQTLRKYQMKLNPSKCAFGVYSGKFLGFMVSQRGIEANPDKIKAILEMQPPKNIKEKAFEWTDECQQAFEELKRYLTEPPLLSPSKQGEELYLYLAVSPTAVSSALIREEERRQLPVYYTSRALRGAEERYPPMEKLAFALVTAARKLRPYFQAHTIVLLTNHPLRKAMSKPDAAGRLIQWSIELSEFDIDYPTANSDQGSSPGWQIS